MYLYFYHHAIKNIKLRLGDDVKIIIMLRNPIDRAYSAFQHVSRGLKEELSFEKALEVEEEKKVLEHYGSLDSGASLGDILGAALEKAQDKSVDRKDLKSSTSKTESKKVKKGSEDKVKPKSSKKESLSKKVKKEKAPTLKEKKPVKEKKTSQEKNVVKKS